jgi:hypothetical protein
MALEPGDHIWYYDGQGNDQAIQGEQTSTDMNIPRGTWFPNSDPNDPNDYSGNGPHIYNYVVYSGGQLRRGQPQMRTSPGGQFKGSFAWLDSNPGNLTGTAGGPDFGQFANKFNWHNFLIFPDHDTGFNAIAAFLKQAPYPDLSVLDAFNRYAPSNDPGNNPTTYANAVVNAINANGGGVTVDTLLRDLTDDQKLEMQNEIEQIEGTIEGDSVSVGDDSVPQVIKDLVGQVQPDP